MGIDGMARTEIYMRGLSNEFVLCGTGSGTSVFAYKNLNYVSKNDLNYYSNESVIGYPKDDVNPFSDASIFIDS